MNLMHRNEKVMIKDNTRKSKNSHTALLNRDDLSTTCMGAMHADDIILCRHSISTCIVISMQVSEVHAVRKRVQMLEHTKLNCLHMKHTFHI